MLVDHEGSVREMEVAQLENLAHQVRSETCWDVKGCVLSFDELLILKLLLD